MLLSALIHPRSSALIRGWYFSCSFAATFIKELSPPASPERLRSTMRSWVWLLVLVPALLRGGIPATDSRETEIADFRTHFKMADYATRKQWEARKQRLRQQILSAAGLLPMPPKPPVHAKIVRRLDQKDYQIETVLLETLPGYYLGANLYRPLGKKGPFPAVLSPHGHWKRGRMEDQPSYSPIALAINLARKGYVAITYDMVGYNDTQQTPHNFGGWGEVLWSFNPMGLQLWNSIRVVDYLQSLPDVDGRRIAATGASGGGTQTFLLAAVDDRVGFAAPVNMVSAYMQGGDPCEEAPGLHVDTFNVEIAAMMAPRPMLLVSSTHDWTKHTPLEEFPEIEHIYGLYGAAQNVKNIHIDAEHNYNRQSREAVYRFFAQHMLGGRPQADQMDEDIVTPTDEELLAFPKSGPRDEEGYAEVFQTWKIASLQVQTAPDPEAQREALRSALGAEWPVQIESVVGEGWITISRTGRNDRVNGRWSPGKGSPVLVVHPGGWAAAARTDAVKRVLQSGRPVLMIEPFAAGEQRTRKQRSDAYFLSYNRTDAADRVQDILTALAFLKTRSSARPQLIGIGDAGVWSLFAAAVAPVAVDVVADLNGFSGTDDDFHDRFFVPGIQRAGGLNAALRLVNRVRVTMNAAELETNEASRGADQ
jgi:dienelactone hydrolase